MALTTARAGLTPQLWDDDFFIEYVRSNRFKRYMGTDENSIIHLKEDLTKKKGDRITFAAVNKLTGAGVTGKVYLSITGGAAADPLVGVKVASDVAGGATLTPETEVAVPATETVNLDEDATYIELTDLAGPLELNRGFEITLEFETSPDVKVEVVVRDGGVAN